jgi:hypothetical protein
LTLVDVLIEALQRKPCSRPELETYAAEHGKDPAGVPRALWHLKRANRVQHVQRAGRYRRSLYALA